MTASMRVAIFGTGSFAREVLELIMDWTDSPGDDALRRELRFAGFLDEDSTRWEHTVHGFPILGGTEWVSRHPDVNLILGIGNPRSKKHVFDICSQQEVEFPTFVHGHARTGRFVRLGRGTLIFAGASLTTGIRLDDFVTVNVGATIGADSVLSRFSVVGPGSQISSGVHLLEGCEIGAGSVISRDLSLGAWSKVQPGSMVVEDVAPMTKVAGNPAVVVGTVPGPRED